MTTDLTTRLPLAVETPETIRARLLADVNAGIDPGDPTYQDTVGGSIWLDLNGAMSLELDRVYDRAHNEVPAAALPATAVGEWLDGWASALGLTRLDETSAFGIVEFTAAAGTAVPTGTQVSTVQTSADSDPVTLQVTAGAVVGVSGVLDLAVLAITAGAAGNVAASTVTQLGSPLANPATVNNPDAITGGSDVETDEALSKRILRKMSGTAAGGNADWYINEALNEPGVGFATVFVHTPSPGHVTLSITDVNNDPFAGGSPVVISLQNRLDPSSSPSQGAGEAPAGATVHISTPSATNITLVATIVPTDGYTLDGTGGTRALRQTITDAVSRYVDALPVGGDVVHNTVLAAIIDVEGVYDVSALTLNGSGANVAIDSTHVASLVKPLTLT